jgi:hypothetical protein
MIGQASATAVGSGSAVAEDPGVDFFWRSPKAPLWRYEDWLSHLDDKNRKAGTSAPTLAAAWAGPLDLLGTLSTVPALRSFVPREAVVEARATFDDHGGNVRNHDLVLRGQTRDGDEVVVCVEAKAGEPLGATLAEQLAAAEQALTKNPRSKAVARVGDLVERFCREGIADQATAALRYQLLTAWAGTLADALDVQHAVFAVHEFRTDQRPEDKSKTIGDELIAFGKVVLGCELPTAGSTPWCVPVQVPDADAQFYLAHLVTDLRSETVVGPGG